MKNLKKLILIPTILTLIGSTALFTAGCQSSATAKSSSQTAQNTQTPTTFNIGITQIVQHPSLDAIRSGIEAGLKDQGYEVGKNLVLDYQNAQGSMENAQLIAQQFNTKEKNLVIAITTPCAQAAFQTVKEAPVIFSAITDPEGAGLKAKGITGVSDMTPVQKQLDLLKLLLPNAKTIGMVYNTGEQNSVVQVELAKALAEPMGLTIEAVGISTTNDLATALDQVLSKSDVFYAHVDNSLASGFALLMEKANGANIPVIGSVEDYVLSGALATDGINNYQIGYQTGLMAAKVLSGQSVDQLPIETIDKTELVLSQSAMKKFGITLPDGLTPKLVP